MTRLPIRKLNLIGYADRPLQRGLGSHPTDQGGGPHPSLGYFFMQGKQPDGSYVTISGLNADASRSTLQGKAA